MNCLLLLNQLDQNIDGWVWLHWLLQFVKISFRITRTVYFIGSLDQIWFHIPLVIGLVYRALNIQLLLNVFPSLCFDDFLCFWPTLCIIFFYIYQTRSLKLHIGRLHIRLGCSLVIWNWLRNIFTFSKTCELAYKFCVINTSHSF